MAVTFGKYQLLKRIAVGGMAEIFLGYVQGAGGFKKPVALKRLLPQHAQDPESVKSFLEEARLLARFEHPNIVQIFDVGQLRSSYFLAMEFVHGVSLERLNKLVARKQQELPLDYLASIVRDACDALEYVHEFTAPDGAPLHLIHRDVSPQNIMLTFSGLVKVLDFGVAKASSSLGSTNPSGLKGKAAYMSPEQIAQVPDLDRRTDVFSLGIVMFELATRRRPFEGLSEIDVILSIDKHAVPDPRGIDPRIPDDLAEIILKALEKDRDRRYASARALQIDLDRFLRQRNANVSKQNLAAFMRELVPRKKPRAPGAAAPTESGEFSAASLTAATESGEYSAASMAAASGLDDPLLTEEPEEAGPAAVAPVEPAEEAPAGLAAPGVPEDMPTPVEDAASSPPAAAHEEPLFSSLAQPRRPTALVVTLIALLLLGGGLALFLLKDRLFGGSPAEPQGVAPPPPGVAPPAPSPPLKAPEPAAPTLGEPPTPDAGEAEARPLPTAKPGPVRPRPGAPADKPEKVKPAAGWAEVDVEPETETAEPRDPRLPPATPAPAPEPTPAPAPEPTPAPALDPTPAPEPASEPAPAPRVVAVAKPASPTFQSLEEVRKRRVAGADPEYPPAARAARLQAIVLVKVFISPTGEVESFNFLKTHEVFEPSVRAALKTWRFSPHTLGGRPVGTYTVYKFVFKLD